MDSAAYIKIKPITKFFIFDIFSSENTTKKYSGVINFSAYFWNKLLSLEFFCDFVENSYKPFIKTRLTGPQYELFLQEYEFIKKRLDKAKDNISFLDRETAPSAEDVFFCYRLFDIMLSCYNNYFENSKIQLSLREGLLFKENIEGVESFFKLIKKPYGADNLFFSSIITPFFDECLKTVSLEPKLASFELFWPAELTQVALLRELIGKKFKTIKVAVDFSNANEQFDFTQWVDLIKKAGKRFFEIFDYFIVYRDFGKAISLILCLLEGNKTLKDLRNVIYYDSELEMPLFTKHPDSELEKDMVESFIRFNFDTKGIGKILGKNSFISRFLPYKCYWNNCSFCAINTNNQFVFDKNYGYEFFIDLWLDFIEKNKIYAINFKDEAIPPFAILLFAKKVLERGLVINYQFRTRMEKMFTKENCELLSKSGNRYCGMGLEAVVDRVNQQLGNKGNENLTIKDKGDILKNFDDAGVSVHNYSIMGFPGETELEFSLTYRFLLSNVKKLRYFTCTPNIFGLMKGTKIFDNLQDYSIECNQADKDNPFLLNLNFTYKGKKRPSALLDKFANDIHREQFLPWLDNSVKGVDFRAYWDFIDRSFIFYMMKRFHFPSPYKSYAQKVAARLETNGTSQELGISEYCGIFTNPENGQKYVYDYVLCKRVDISESIARLINTINAHTSMSKITKDLDQKDNTILQTLISDKVLFSYSCN